jgi:hypothetical protein
VNLEVSRGHRSVLAVQMRHGIGRLTTGEAAKMDLPTHLLCHVYLYLDPSSYGCDDNDGKQNVKILT